MAPLLCAAMLGAGCSRYNELRLPDRPGLAASLADLPLPASAAARLGVADLAVLAVANNPDLRAVRAQRGVAQAQLLQAGLPPNPAVTGAILPLAAGVGSTPAYNAGISYDLKSLLTRPARRRSAEAAAGQVDAQILWQEWQVVGQARLLAVDLMSGNRNATLVAGTMGVLARRLAAAQAALAAGNTTLAAVAPDLSALQSVRTQETDLARQQLGRRHQLAALLGLWPDAPVPLADTPELPAFDPAAIRRDLPTLASRRPDLVALQLGYRSQDEKLRAAILAQFPNLTFGITGGSDNSNVRNVGPQVTLELPLFDRNQGNIAIETATRQQLRDEYEARLKAAHGQVQAMLGEIALLTSQIGVSRDQLGPVRRAAASAQSAFAAGNLDERSYVDLITARLAKEQEILGMEQSLLEQQVAVATLTGAGMPTARTNVEPDAP